VKSVSPVNTGGGSGGIGKGGKFQLAEPEVVAPNRVMLATGPDEPALWDGKPVASMVHPIT